MTNQETGMTCSHCQTDTAPADAHCESPSCTWCAGEAATASNNTTGGWWPPIYPLCRCGSPSIICQHEQPSDTKR